MKYFIAIILFYSFSPMVASDTKPLTVQCEPPATEGAWSIRWTDLSARNYRGTVRINGPIAVFSIECSGYQGIIHQKAVAILNGKNLRLTDSKITGFTSSKGEVYHADNFDLHWDCKDWKGVWRDGRNKPTNTVVMSRN